MNIVAEKLSLPEAFIELDNEITIRNNMGDKAQTDESMQLEQASEAQTWSSTESDFTPASIPATCVPNVTDQGGAGLSNVHAKLEPDLISSGIITRQQAEDLFDTYRNRLDHYVYRIIGHLDSLDAVRKESPLLTAAICAVAALHHVSSNMPYDKCFEEFVRLSAIRMFSGRSSINDVQAFVIGAFWLKELSWILSGAGMKISSL